MTLLMRKNILSTLCFIVLLTLSLSVQAGSVKHGVKSFTEMEKYINKISSPKATLVVMDNDDTLTMMSCPDANKPETCQYLGGPAWFSWQESQIKALAQPRVANSFNELLVASALAFSINYMAYTASDVPVVLNRLADSGVRLIVETARGNANVSATEQQFLNLTTNSKQSPNLLKLISNHSLKFGPQNIASKASPYLPCNDTSLRPITYRQGVMYLSGQNKGIILKCMLDSYSNNASAITHIVFIDDTEKNVINVHKAFENSTNYEVYALHYTKLKAHKKALTEGKMAETYQEYAMKRWKAISDTLEVKLQNPVLP